MHVLASGRVVQASCSSRPDLWLAWPACLCWSSFSAGSSRSPGHSDRTQSPVATPAPAPAPAATPAPTPAGSATLTWVAPQTKADGSALRDLAGFKIYYGTVSGNYPASITVPNPAATTHTIQALPAGTYYFVVKAYDKSNTESAPSAEVSKTIR